MNSFKLICGDALAEMEKMPDASIDVVFTSPPYNLGESRGSFPVGGTWRKASYELARGYEGFDDALPYSAYIEWQHKVLRECWRLLSPSGAIFYNHKPRIVKGQVRLPTVLNPNLPLRQIVIWDRGGAMNYNRSFFAPNCEWILILAKPAFRLASRSTSAIGDVWTIPCEINTPHPAPFPLELPLRALRALGPELQTVLDPFAGWGTTGLAALKTGRDFIGIEQSQKYVDLARQRLEDVTGTFSPRTFGGLFEESTP